MRIILTLISTMLTMYLAAQEITERAYPLSLGEQNAFVIEHDKADKKQVEKVVQKAIKEYGKVKRNRKANEWSCLECTVPGLSGATNIYYKIEEGKGLTSSYLFFDDGTKFISSENAEAAAASIRKQLNYIKHDVTRVVITKEMEMEEDNLKDKNKDLEKLEKKNKELHEKIEEYRKKISEAEKNIEQNLQEQEDKKMEIEKQIKTVEEVVTRLNNVGKN